MRETCDCRVASGCFSPLRVRSIAKGSPTQVSDPASPHGPSPRWDAFNSVIRCSGTSARPAASTFAGSRSLSAVVINAGNSATTSSMDSPCSRWACSSPFSIDHQRTPARSGRSNNSATAGGTCPVSESTEFLPAITRSKATLSLAEPFANAAALRTVSIDATSARAVARVSEPANSGPTI